MSNPTAAQKRTFARIAELGCMACKQDGVEDSPAEIHHMKRYGYRDHSRVVSLCPRHHGLQHAVPGTPNRHANPLEFAEKYGTDAELVAECKKLIGE